MLTVTLELGDPVVINNVTLVVKLFVNRYRATGFTTRSDIGPARDADDIPYVNVYIFSF